MVSWFNYVTTDIIGDLAFGESFGGLENNEMHPWLANLFETVKIHSFSRELSRYPKWVAYIIRMLISSKKQQVQSDKAVEFGAKQAQKRMKRGTERTDFMSYLLRHTDERGSVLRIRRMLNQFFDASILDYPKLKLPLRQSPGLSQVAKLVSHNLDLHSK